MSDWFNTGYDKMMQHISEASGLSAEQVKNVYNTIHWLGLIDYDIEKEVVFEQFTDEGQEDSE